MGGVETVGGDVSEMGPVIEVKQKSKNNINGLILDFRDKDENYNIFKPCSLQHQNSLSHKLISQGSISKENITQLQNTNR